MRNEQLYLIHSMKEDIQNRNDVLSHHGILGMKWGVRRYQNPDGSLTNEGKDRYAKREEKKNSGGRKISGVAKTVGIVGYGAGHVAAGLTRSKDEKDRSTSLKNSSSKLLKDSDKLQKAEERLDYKKQAKSMNDDELKTIVNRLTMEQKYEQLMEKDVAYGKTELSDLLDTVGDVVVVASSAVILASMLSKKR